MTREGQLRFVVTGASGHLGANVVRALAAAGETVRAVDVRPGAAFGGLDVEWFRADVVDPSTLVNAFSGADFVLHLAARISIAGDPDGSVRRVNVDGVRHVAEAALAAGVRRLVHCSSLHAYDVGAIRGPVRENAPRATDPGLPAYDRSKAAGEDELRRVVDRGLDAVILNPSGMFGPLDPEPSRMGRVLLAMFKGRMPIAVRGAFDWVDVRDVAAALIAAADRGRQGENYLVGGHRASVTELGRLAAEVAGRRPPRLAAPLAPVQLAAEAAVRLAGPRRAGRLLLTPESLHALATDPVVDCSKAIAELGYRPRPLADTVADLHASFVADGRVSPKR
ncbi:MAG TPA: NAD-dependent epimerase/dehydratase family protein, partial [Acidimicrobiia bacterium]|nr:NAD-dependent epimerase/dehydratase family protein [Acidimicrobiia bacterium]